MQVLKSLQAAGMAVALSLSANAWANDDHDTEGRIESINQQERSFVVNGMTLYADPSTDYDDNLNNFADLQVGQRVEVDYVVRSGKHHAKEIELDD